MMMVTVQAVIRKDVKNSKKKKLTQLILPTLLTLKNLVSFLVVVHQPKTKLIADAKHVSKVSF